MAAYQQSEKQKRDEIFEQIEINSVSYRKKQEELLKENRDKLRNYSNELITLAGGGEEELMKALERRSQISKEVWNLLDWKKISLLQKDKIIIENLKVIAKEKESYVMVCSPDGEWYTITTTEANLLPIPEKKVIITNPEKGKTEVGHYAIISARYNAKKYLREMSLQLDELADIYI